MARPRCSPALSNLSRRAIRPDPSPISTGQIRSDGLGELIQMDLHGFSGDFRQDEGEGVVRAWLNRAKTVRDSGSSSVQSGHGGHMCCGTPTASRSAARNGWAKHLPWRVPLRVELHHRDQVPEASNVKRLFWGVAFRIRPAPPAPRYRNGWGSRPHAPARRQLSWPNRMHPA
jgi:hypothetical protein